MIRAALLFESAFVRMLRIDHPADAPHVDPDEETSEAYSINFIERGGFAVAHRGRSWNIGAGQVFVTIPGQLQTYTHHAGDHPPDDVCLAICYTDGVRDQLEVRRAQLGDRAPVVGMTNRLAYLHGRTRRYLTPIDSLALDTLAFELLDATLLAAPGPLFRPSQLTWYAPRIDAARVRLDEDYARPHTLSELSRDAGMSPFHFARIFKELAGVPPHRYLLRRRLAVALGQLRDGRSVTDTCFAVGFSSLSHFIRAFRAQYGQTPSRAVHISAGPDTTSS